MFRLRTGYFISGIFTGILILISFIRTLPDGKLHVHICDVGQGNAVYIRFPDGRDALIDAGPGSKVLGCLGEYMPFWDRNIDLAFLSHPQKDHMGGFVDILSRYGIGTFIMTGLDSNDEAYKRLAGILSEKRIPVRTGFTGDVITVGAADLHILWPPGGSHDGTGTGAVLGVQSHDANQTSMVVHLSYGQFDAYFPGDADLAIQNGIMQSFLGSDPIELFAVPHHGSKTGFNAKLLDWLRPKIAVISVGKNTYGHPTKEVLSLLDSYRLQTMRTDQDGDIEVISNGSEYNITNHPKIE